MACNVNRPFGCYEDGFAAIPERPVESSTDEEEWTNNNAGSSEIVVTKVVEELDIEYFHLTVNFLIWSTWKIYEHKLI